MSYLAQYGDACDYIRELLTLPPETSVQEIIVKFTDEFKRVKALKDSQPSVQLVDAISTSGAQTGKLEIKTWNPEPSLALQKPKKKTLSKSQRLKKLKKRHSMKKDSQEAS